MERFANLTVKCEPRRAERLLTPGVNRRIATVHRGIRLLHQVTDAPVHPVEHLRPVEPRAADLNQGLPKAALQLLMDFTAYSLSHIFGSRLQ